MSHEEETTHPEQVKKAKELLSSFSSGMLVTSAMDEQPHARPMRIAELDDDGMLSFVTALSSGKVDEIRRRPGVVVTMQSENLFVSASGDAKVVTDLQEKRRVWELGAELWFNGPEDPEAALIQLQPETVEYWDQRGFNSIRLLFQAARALATGDSPREEDMRAHARVTI
jgi:general stress protein 26